MTVARSVADVLDDHVVFEVESIDAEFWNPTGVWQPDYGFPFLSGAGQFLVKDLVFLGAATFTAGDALNAASARRGAR